MKIFTLFLFSFFITHLCSQVPTDPWICSQMGPVTWHQTFEGVLADYHPVTITLASDNKVVAGYLIHKGDNRTHRLMGDWNKKDLFQLQERDEFDRLTGYLSGSMSGDQLHMEWMSPDQGRLFEIVAYPKNLIKVNSFKPVSELIEVDADKDMVISVQKMGYGIVSGIAGREGTFTRFEGYCLDGSCSIWNTVLQNNGGAPIKIQMRQRDLKNYRAVIDGKEFPATITSAFPLGIRQFDNSMGFLDFTYPMLDSKPFEAWTSLFIDKHWMDGVAHLNAMNQPGSSGRLVHRSSGWIEIMDTNEDFVSGMVTYINPGSVRRSSFIWLKKEDAVISPTELLNAPEDFTKAATQSLKHIDQQKDEEYKNWLQSSGYTHMMPTRQGVMMVTDFSMIYGDNMHRLTVDQSKLMIKRKYWKYFGW